MKPGLKINIPGWGDLTIDTIVTDYTGTLSKDGVLVAGVGQNLLHLCDQFNVWVLTADTFGKAKAQLHGLQLSLRILSGDCHDRQKLEFIQSLTGAGANVASFGNGRNDRLMLDRVRSAGGLAVAVDAGEGCAVEAIMSSSILINGADVATSLLLNPDRIKATLRA